MLFKKKKNHNCIEVIGHGECLVFTGRELGNLTLLSKGTIGDWRQGLPFNIYIDEKGEIYLRGKLDYYAKIYNSEQEYLKCTQSDLFLLANEMYKKNYLMDSGKRFYKPVIEMDKMTLVKEGTLRNNLPYQVHKNDKEEYFFSCDLIKMEMIADGKKEYEEYPVEKLEKLYNQVSSNVYR